MNGGKRRRASGAPTLENLVTHRSKKIGYHLVITGLSVLCVLRRSVSQYFEKIRQ